MLRRLFVVLFALALAQESNLGSLLLGAECLETCPDDTVPGHCPPACAACSCGTHANPVAPELTTVPPLASSGVRPLDHAAFSPGESHLSDILHVPKRPLA